MTDSALLALRRRAGRATLVGSRRLPAWTGGWDPGRPSPDVQPASAAAATPSTAARAARRPGIGAAARRGGCAGGRHGRKDPMPSGPLRTATLAASSDVVTRATAPDGGDK